MPKAHKLFLVSVKTTLVDKYMWATKILQIMNFIVDIFVQFSQYCSIDMKINLKTSKKTKNL
jgi:hypothetical protein